MPILLLRSEAEETLGKVLQDFQLCQLRNWWLSVSTLSCEALLWVMINLLMVFSHKALDQITFCTWPKTLAKQAKQWMNISLPDCSEWAFFSFSLKFNHVHWLVPSNTYECPYSRRKLSYSTFGPNFFKKWWFKGLALGSLSEVGSGEVDNFHSSQKDFFHWYWPSL